MCLGFPRTFVSCSVHCSVVGLCFVCACLCLCVCFFCAHPFFITLHASESCTHPRHQFEMMHAETIKKSIHEEGTHGLTVMNVMNIQTLGYLSQPKPFKYIHMYAMYVPATSQYNERKSCYTY